MKHTINTNLFIPFDFQVVLPPLALETFNNLNNGYMISPSRLNHFLYRLLCNGMQNVLSSFHIVVPHCFFFSRKRNLINSYLGVINLVEIQNKLSGVCLLTFAMRLFYVLHATQPAYSFLKSVCNFLQSSKTVEPLYSRSSFLSENTVSVYMKLSTIVFSCGR